MNRFAKFICAKFVAAKIIAREKRTPYGKVGRHFKCQQAGYELVLRSLPIRGTEYANSQATQTR